MENLKYSFPDKSEKERKKIAWKFYRHLCDLMVESIKMFSISKKELEKRIKYKNPELLNSYIEQNKNICMVGGHYGNWEWSAVTFPLHIEQQVNGIFFPIKNRFLNKKMQGSRGRFGLKLIKAKEIKDQLKNKKNQLILFLGDQSPSNPKSALELNFLNQKTLVLKGFENYSRNFNTVAMYGQINKISRGKYEVVFELITENPMGLKTGELTKIHTLKLEQAILTQPEYWLWSHKRWKKTREYGQ